MVDQFISELRETFDCIRQVDIRQIRTQVRIRPQCMVLAVVDVLVEDLLITIWTNTHRACVHLD